MSDPYTPRRSLPPQQGYGQPAPQQYSPPAGYAVERQGHRQAPQRGPSPDYGHGGRFTLTAAEAFWYIVGNISFGAMYFAKIPAKKAMAQAGMCEMTGAESFWYVLMCIWFGAGYFAKIPVAKALTELDLN